MVMTGIPKVTFDNMKEASSNRDYSKDVNL